MKKRFVWRGILALTTVLAFAVLGRAQAPGAGGARGNAPAPNAAAAQGRGGGGGPIAGPPHDAHDLNGVWNLRGFAGGGGFGGTGAKLTTWGQDLFKSAKSSNSGQYTLSETNDPVITKCFPPGVPRIYLQPFPWQIVQAAKETLLIYEYDHTVRHVFTDGRKHPEEVTLTYMGDSTGRWDGDTFVVDTIGFNEKTWLDRVGTGHSDQLHVIERFHRVNLNDLELDVTMEDAKALAAPWNVHMQVQLHPEWAIQEQVCTDNGDFLNFEK